MDDYSKLVLNYISEDGSRKTLIFRGTKLGSGGYGDVYKASLDGYGLVAAKVCPLTEETMQNVSEMLYLECDVSTYNLKHSVLMKKYIYNPVRRDILGTEHVRQVTGNPNINFGSVSEECPPEIVVIIYDLVDGVNLQEDMKTHILMWINYSKDVIIHYAHCMIKGLVEMSDNGIAHRDIKPANFMIQRGSVRYIDFGLSCKYEKCPKKGRGTKAYIPMEIYSAEFAKSKNGVDIWDKIVDLHKADVYALGRTLASFFFDTTNPDFTKIQDNTALYEYVSPTTGVFSELIFGMLNFDVSQRLTAQQALAIIDSMRPSLLRRIAYRINPFRR